MELHEMTKRELRALYLIEFGKKAGILTETQLIDAIKWERSRREYFARRQAELKAETEAQTQKIAERVARKITRGDLTVFMSAKISDLSEDECKVRWLLRKANKDIALSEAGVAKFAKDMLDDPIRALSWADSVFHTVALGRIAQEVMMMINDGFLFVEIKETLKEHLVSKAKSSHSSSTSSNQISQAVVVATAEYLSDI